MLVFLLYFPVTNFFQKVKGELKIGHFSGHL
jgi:hypothetical protein